MVKTKEGYGNLFLKQIDKQILVYSVNSNWKETTEEYNNEKIKFYNPGDNKFENAANERQEKLWNKKKEKQIAFAKEDPERDKSRNSLKW